MDLWETICELCDCSTFTLVEVVVVALLTMAAGLLADRGPRTAAVLRWLAARIRGGSKPAPAEDSKPIYQEGKE